MNKETNLWEVHYRSQFYDNDPRMPGDVPIDMRLYVLASSREKALAKSIEGLREEVVKKYGKESLKHEDVVVSHISLENLVVARDSSKDGRLGFFSTDKLSPVQISLEEDLANYKLKVSLVKVDK